MSAVISKRADPNASLSNYEHFEIINGDRVELPEMGARQTVMASFLTFVLTQYALANNLGRVVGEMLFKLDRKGKTQRRPDVAFVSYTRWPKKRPVPDSQAWDVVPNLAIEVNSTSNTANEILKKIRDYFRAGVQRVWVVYPVTEQVYVFSSPAKNVILTASDSLDGETVLPGFQFPLAELFESAPGDSSLQ